MRQAHGGQRSFCVYHVDENGIASGHVTVKAHTAEQAKGIRNDDLFASLCRRYDTDETRRRKEWRANKATHADPLDDAPLGGAADLYAKGAP